MSKSWKNRIVKNGTEAPDQLLANEANWRIHTRPQQDALKGVLDDVGWVQDVIVNLRTSDKWEPGKRNVETLVDGHLRVMLALRHDIPEIPVKYVDLDPAEEALVLATLDPLSAMAAADREKLDELLREVHTGDAAVMEMLTQLAEKAGMYSVDGVDAPGLPDGDKSPFRQMTFTVHDSQFEMIDSAMRQAKRDGGGTSDVNENSNGNALAFICERFING